MRIEIISVVGVDAGAQMLLTLKIGEGDRFEKRKLLIFTESYLEMGLHKGMLLDEATFDKLEELAKTCKAIRKGSDLLAYSSSSKVGLEGRLRKKGFDKQSAKEAVEFLSNLGAIDERYDIERAVESYLKKLWGKKRIYSELVKKGYPQGEILDFLEEIEGEVLVENCKKLIMKKTRVIPHEPNEKKKLVASLVRYGYTFAEIKEAISQI